MVYEPKPLPGGPAEAGRSGDASYGKRSTDRRDLSGLGRAAPIPPGAPLLLDVTEVAVVLGVGRSFVYELLHAGELEFCKLGTRTKVSVASVQRYVERRLAEGHSAPGAAPAVTARGSSPRNCSAVHRRRRRR